MTRLVLASSSPARLALLRSAGIEPEIVLPETDEPALAAQAKLENPNLSAEELVGLLAKAKSESVLHDLSTRGALILGGDSALEFEGEVLGKPHEPEGSITWMVSARQKDPPLSSKTRALTFSPGAV